LDLPLVIPGIAAIPYYQGAELGWTPWLTISEERVRRFVDATGERNWLHTDPERASRSPWKGLVIPGNLLISLVPSLLPELLVMIGWSAAINSGVETCRFGVPTTVGARVRMTAAIGRSRSLPRGGCRLPLDITFEADTATEPICEARVLYLYYP